MRVKFWCEAGYLVNSCMEATINLKMEYDLSEGEWEEMTDAEKSKIVEDWAWNNGLSIGWEDL